MPARNMGRLLTLSLASLVIIVISFILVVVGVGTRGWIQYNNIQAYGLQDWGLLSLLFGGSSGQAAYALCIIATLGAATALTSISIDVILQLLDKRNEKLARILPLVTFIAAIVGGVFGIIGSIVHVAWVGSKFTELHINGYSPGFSFFLTFIFSITLITGGAIAYMSKKGGHIGSLKL